MDGDWSTIFIIPAESVRWDITNDRMKELLVERYSDVGFYDMTVDRRDRGGQVEKYFRFGMLFMGEVRNGSYYGDESLHLDAEPPERWADFIVWFLSVLPTDDPVRFNSELAIENGMLDDNWIPHDATEAQVVDILKAHFTSIEW